MGTIDIKEIYDVRLLTKQWKVYIPQCQSNNQIAEQRGHLEALKF